MSRVLKLLMIVAACCAAPAGAVTFERQDYLAPVDVASNQRARLGYSVATDGQYLVVGATRQPSDANRYEGSVFVYRYQDQQWLLEATLFDLEGEDRFGWSLALQGDTLVVGSPHALRNGAGTPRTGKAHVYRRAFNGAWNPVSTLSAPDGEDGDAFGYSVALRNGVALIGAPADDTGDIANHGSAWAMSTDTSALRQKLVANDAASGDVFGISVALGGDRAFAGAIGADAGPIAGAGAVYAFSTGAGYPQVQKLVATDAASGDGFGIALSASADRLVVGAYQDDVDGRANQGSLHVFARAGADWLPEARIVAADGRAGETLGYSVALSGDAILAGGNAAPRLFRRNAGQWQPALSPPLPDPALQGQVANAVALSGNVALVGWPYAENRGLPERGRAIAYELRSGAWLSQEFALRDSAYGTSFGYSIDIDAGTAVVGGPALCVGDCVPAYAAGGAYVLRRDANGAMQPEATLVAPWSDIDGFGRAVAIDGDTVVVSAGTGYAPNAHEGVYVYVRSGGRWQFDDVLTDAAGTPVQGEQLGIDGDRIVVGHFNDAWIFRRAPAGWVLEAHFTAGVAGRESLSSVALQGDRTYLGLREASVAGVQQGAVYVLVRIGSQWHLEARLLGDAVANEHFGSNLAADGDTLLVGADGSDDVGASRVPAGYIFERGPEGWRRAAKLPVPSVHAGRGLGVAIAGDVALIGGQRSTLNLPLQAFQRLEGEWRAVGPRPDTSNGRVVGFDGVTLMTGERGPNTTTVDVFRVVRD